MKKSVKAIIFDMDGVIVDSEPIHERSEIEVCREFGMNVPKEEWDNFRGKKLEDIFSYTSQEFGTGKEPIEKMIKRKIELYLKYALREIKLIRGALDFLRELEKSQKYRYALTTSGRRNQQEKILKKLKLDDFFPIMVTAEDVRKGKPNPEPYLLTVEKLGEKPNKCLVIEDSDNGIVSAKAAGCQTCGITTTFSYKVLKMAGADLIVSNFEELSERLLD